MIQTRKKTGSQGGSAMVLVAGALLGVGNLWVPRFGWAGCPWLAKRSLRVPARFGAWPGRVATPRAAGMSGMLSG